MPEIAPELAKWLSLFNEKLRAIEERGILPTPETTRDALANLTRGLVTNIPEIFQIRDHVVDCGKNKIPLRVYIPSPENNLPLLLYVHGGGHMAGSIKVYDPICRKIALASRHIVISIDYRLAPEDPYPAGLKDTEFLLRNIHPILKEIRVDHSSRLSMAGDSGGGAICATLNHTFQHDHSIKIDKQVLIYPSLDYTMGQPSVKLNGTGFLLEEKRMDYYFDNYFKGDENRRICSPLHMDFSQNLPESLVITAEFCPLRDEGKLYVEKLQESKAKVSHIHFDDMIHAFLNMEDLVKKQCEKLYLEIASFLKESNGR